MTAPIKLTVAEIGARTFKVVEEGACYLLEVPGCNLSLEVARLDWRDGSLIGELMARCDFAGTEAFDGKLVDKVNLSSARARTACALEFARQSRADDIPWRAL